MGHNGNSIMNKIEVKPTTIKDFKDWAKRHQMPILIDDKKLQEVLDRANEKTRKVMQELAAEVTKK